MVENRDACRVLLGRHEGRRLLDDLGVDGNGSSAMLIILPDEDGDFFIETVYIFSNSVASFPARAVNGVHNVLSVLNKRIRNRNSILH